MKPSFVILTIALFPIVMVGCYRGQRSSEPPLHAFLDMDDQPKVDPYGSNEYFANGAAMQDPIPGTAEFAKDGTPSVKPAYDSELLSLGQRKYQIMCQPCHGASGDGKGLAAIRGVPKGMVPPTSYHTESMRKVTDEHLYDVVVNGIRNMSGYASKLNSQERWAVVAYVRALQLSQHASLSDIPEDIRGTLKEGQ